MQKSAWLILILLCSCGPSAKLRKAERLIQAAINGGADVKRDTTWTTITMKVEGPKFETKLLDPLVGQPVYIFKDSIKVEIKRIPGQSGKRDTLYIAAECPDIDIKKDVPISIDTSVSAGYTLWDLIILAIFCLVVGYFGRIIHVMIKVGRSS